MLISPSMLSADFARLKEELDRVKQGGADWLHIDVMDGHFVPNISFGMPVIRCIRPVSDLFFDVHIMISQPQKYITDLKKSGADLVTFHVEAEGDPAETIRMIHAEGMKAGISVKPGGLRSGDHRAAGVGKGRRITRRKLRKSKEKYHAIDR